MNPSSHALQEAIQSIPYAIDSEWAYDNDKTLRRICQLYYEWGLGNPAHALAFIQNLSASNILHDCEFSCTIVGMAMLGAFKGLKLPEPITMDARFSTRLDFDGNKEHLLQTSAQSHPHLMSTQFDGIGALSAESRGMFENFCVNLNTDLRLAAYDITSQEAFDELLKEHFTNKVHTRLEQDSLQHQAYSMQIERFNVKPIKQLTHLLTTKAILESSTPTGSHNPNLTRL